MYLLIDIINGRRIEEDKESIMHDYVYESYLPNQNMVNYKTEHGDGLNSTVGSEKPLR